MMGGQLNPGFLKSGKMRKMKNIAFWIFMIASITFLSRCEAQTKITIPEDCEIGIDSPQLEAERKAYQDTISDQRTTIRRLGDIIETDGQKMAEMDQTIKSQAGEISTLTSANSALSDQVEKQADTITDLRTKNGNQAEQISNLLDMNDALVARNQAQKDTIETQKQIIADLEDRPGGSCDSITVGGIRYAVKDIQMIRPEKEIDTIMITHCADSTKNTTWFHHGGVDLPYPKDISMASKELGFVRIHFKDSLTNEIKVQKSYLLKRIRNYKEAHTSYEFVK